MSKKVNNDEKLNLLIDQLNLELIDINPDNLIYAKDLNNLIASTIIQMEINPNDESINKYNDLMFSVATNHPNKIKNIIKIANEVYSGPDNDNMRNLIYLPIFSYKEQHDRINELSNIRTSIDENAKQDLHNTLDMRLPGNFNDFKRTGDKQEGMNQGYTAEHNNTQYMLKPGKKSQINVKNHQEKDERIEIVNEIMSAAIAPALLYNRTPKIKTISGAGDPDNIYVGSQYLNNASNLIDFKLPHGQYLGDSKYGLEKIVAASNLLNDVDYTDKNVMVAPGSVNKIDEEGLINEQTGSVLFRIDYGKSFGSVPRHFFDIVTTLHEFNDENGYLNTSHLKFNIKEYSSSLNQMLENISDPQYTDSLIDQKIEELKKTDFDPRGLELANGDKDNPVIIKIDNFEQLGEFYKNRIKNNVQIYKEAAKDFEIIAKFDSDEQFKDGDWLKEIYSSNQDPVQYAIANNINIVDINPNTGNIEKYDAEEWLEMKGYELDEDGARKSFSIATLATPKKANWTKNVDGKWKIVDQDYLNNANTVEVKPNPATKLSPILADANPENVVTELTSLVDEFSEQSKNSKITSEQVKEFHNKSLEIFKDGGYLSDIDIANIKNSHNYADDINNKSQAKGVKRKRIDTNPMPQTILENFNMQQAIIDSLSVSQKYINKNKQVSGTNKRDFTKEVSTRINNRQNKR